MSLTQLVPPAFSTLSGQQNTAPDGGKRFLKGAMYAITDAGEEFVNKEGPVEIFQHRMITLRHLLVFPSAVTNPGAIIYKGTKHYGSDGTSWNALY